MTFKEYCKNVYDKFNIEIEKQKSKNIFIIDNASILLSQYFEVIERRRQSHCIVDKCGDFCIHKEIEDSYKNLGTEIIIHELSLQV